MMMMIIIVQHPETLWRDTPQLSSSLLQICPKGLWLPYNKSRNKQTQHVPQVQGSIMINQPMQRTFHCPSGFLWLVEGELRLFCNACTWYRGRMTWWTAVSLIIKHRTKRQETWWLLLENNDLSTAQTRTQEPKGRFCTDSFPDWREFEVKWWMHCISIISPQVFQWKVSGRVFCSWLKCLKRKETPRGKLKESSRGRSNHDMFFLPPFWQYRLYLSCIPFKSFTYKDKFMDIYIYIVIYLGLHTYK